MADSDVAKISDLDNMFGNVVEVIMTFAGIAFFILLLVGGFKYITAGSDPKAVEGAKKTLTFAIVGIILIAASYLILVLINQLTGAEILDFSVMGPK